MKIFTDDVIYTNDQNSNDHYVSLLLMPDEFLSKLAINNKSQIFFYLKGMIMAFLKTQLASAIVANITCKVNKNETLHPYLNSSLSFDDMQLVTFGAINLTTLKNYDLDDSTYVAEINCSRILTLIEKNVKSDNFKFAR